MSSPLKKFIESQQDKIDYSFPGIPGDFHDDKYTEQLGLEMVMRVRWLFLPQNLQVPNPKVFQNNKLYMYKMDRDEEDEEDESASEVTSEEPPKNGVTEEQEEELPREEVTDWAWSSHLTWLKSKVSMAHFCLSTHYGHLVRSCASLHFDGTLTMLKPGSIRS